METPQSRVLNSMLRIPEDRQLPCCHANDPASPCSEPRAVWVWPAVAAQPKAYCETHLNDAMLRLSIALGT